MVSIFIRTYRNDIKWLKYCLKSIRDNLTGYIEVVVAIPNGQEDLLQPLEDLIDIIVVTDTYTDDYLGQQATKMQAHKWCSGDYILFVDSDVIFSTGADVKDYFENERPIIAKCEYSKVGEAVCWKPITEKFFGEKIKHEYMRFAPQIFNRHTLESINESYPNLEAYIISQPYRKFSEFNVLGYYAEKTHPDLYTFLDTDSKEMADFIKRNKAQQYWSWGGITPHVAAKINEQLN